jgi:hypothetical protein
VRTDKQIRRRARCGDETQSKSCISTESGTWGWRINEWTNLNAKLSMLLQRFVQLNTFSKNVEHLLFPLFYAS